MRRREGTGRAVTKRNWELRESAEKGKRTGFTLKADAERDLHGLENLEDYFGTSEKKKNVARSGLASPLATLDLNRAVDAQRSKETDGAAKKETKRKIPSKQIEQSVKPTQDKDWLRRVSIRELGPIEVPSLSEESPISQKYGSSLKIENMFDSGITSSQDLLLSQATVEFFDSAPSFVPKKNYKPTAPKLAASFEARFKSELENDTVEEVEQRKTLQGTAIVPKPRVTLADHMQNTHQEAAAPSKDLQSLQNGEEDSQSNTLLKRNTGQSFLTLLKPQATESKPVPVSPPQGLQETVKGGYSPASPQSGTNDYAESFLDSQEDLVLSPRSGLAEDPLNDKFNSLEQQSSTLSLKDIRNRRISTSPPPALNMKPYSMDTVRRERTTQKKMGESPEQTYDSPRRSDDGDSEVISGGGSIASGSPLAFQSSSPYASVPTPKSAQLSPAELERSNKRRRALDDSEISKPRRNKPDASKRRRKRRSVVSSIGDRSSDEDEIDDGDYSDADGDVHEEEEEMDSVDMSLVDDKDQEEDDVEDVHDDARRYEEGYMKRVQKYMDQGDRYNIKPFRREEGRSKRRRFPPLRFWEGERIQYRRGTVLGQNVSEAVVAGKPEFMVTPEPQLPRSVIQQNQMSLSGTGKRRGGRAKVLPPTWPKDLRFNDPDSPVKITDDKGKTNDKHVVRSRSDISFTSLPPDVETQFTTHDGMVVRAATPEAGAAFDDDRFLSGLVNLPPLSSKAMENGMDHVMVFVVVESQELAVAVHMNDMVFQVSKGDQFWVPPKTEYSVRNYSEVKDAEIAFVSIKP